MIYRVLRIRFRHRFWPGTRRYPPQSYYYALAVALQWPSWS